MEKTMTILTALDVAWRVGLFVVCVFFLKELIPGFKASPERKVLRLSLALVILSDLAQISTIFRPEKSELMKSFIQMIFNMSLLSTFISLIFNLRNYEKSK